MAVVTIVHTWPNKETITVQVGDSTAAYPDELRQLRVEAVSIYYELVVEADPDQQP